LKQVFSRIQQFVAGCQRVSLGSASQSMSPEGKFHGYHYIHH